MHQCKHIKHWLCLYSLLIILVRAVCVHFPKAQTSIYDISIHKDIWLKNAECIYFHCNYIGYIAKHKMRNNIFLKNGNNNFLKFGLFSSKSLGKYYKHAVFNCSKNMVGEYNENNMGNCKYIIWQYWIHLRITGFLE
jgi:hypothetical protein